MPTSHSTRKRRFNKCCCCNPLTICSSMLGLRRSPLCECFIAQYVLGMDLTIIAARKPSSSSNTTKPLNEMTGEGTSSKAMANDAPAVNGSQNYENIKTEKPAVIAKEPTVAKRMVYEPNPIQKANGLSNGTTNHTSYSMNQRKTIHFSKPSTLSLTQMFFHRPSIPHEYLRELGGIKCRILQRPAGYTTSRNGHHNTTKVSCGF